MSLLRLSPHILCMIADACDSCQQVASLVRANRHLYNVCNPRLYKRNKDEPPVHSCVWWAVEHGSLGTLEHALAAGADVNMTGAEYLAPSRFFTFPLPHPHLPHVSPLHIAVEKGFLRIVRFLLVEGAAVDGTSRGLCKCYLRDMQQMMRHDTAVHDLHYPLHYAVRHKKPSSNSIASLLLERGAYFAEPDIPGLRWAMIMGSSSTINIFIQHEGFDPLATDEWGFTALHYVAHCPGTTLASNLVPRLCDLGVPRDAISSDGTALQCMIAAGNHDPARILVHRGASVDVGMVLRGGGSPDHAWWINCPPLWLVLHDFIGDFSSCWSSKDTKRRIVTPYPELGEERRELIRVLIWKDVGITQREWHGPTSGAPSLLPSPLTLALYPTHDVRFMKILLEKGLNIKDDNELASVGDALRRYEADYHSKAESGMDIYPYPDIEADRNMFPGPGGLLHWFFKRFCRHEPETIWQREFTRKEFEPFKDCLKLLLKKGARIDQIDSVRSSQSALGLTCALAAGYLGCEGLFALEFLVKHATHRNVEQEHVLDLMDTWRRYGVVHGLLRQLCDKVMARSRKQ